MSPVQLGADTRQLDLLAGALRRHAAALDGIHGELSAVVEALWWRGRDAERFRSAWQAALRPTLRGAAVELRGAADHVERQATDQTRASASDGLAPAARVVDAGSPRVVARSTATIELGAAMGYAGAATVAVTIEDRDDGTSIVSLDGGLGAGVGVMGGSGAQIAASGRPVAGAFTAHATALGTVGTGSSWIVPSDHVDDLLTAWGRDHLLGPAASASAGLARAVDEDLGGVLSAGAGALGLGGAWAAATAPLPTEAASRVELGVAVDADARAGSGRVSGVGSVAGAATVAVIEDHRSGSTIVELRDTVGGEAWLRGVPLASHLGGEGEMSSTIRVELDRDGTPVALTGTVEVRHGATKEVVDLRHELDADAGGAVTRALAAVSGGADVRESMARLASDLESGDTTFESSTWRLDRDLGRSLDVGVGSASAGFERWRRVEPARP